MWWKRSNEKNIFPKLVGFHDGKIKLARFDDQTTFKG